MIKRLAIAFALLALHACGHREGLTDAQRERMNEEAARLGPISLRGITVEAPNDIGWSLTRSTSNSVYYRKTLSPGHTAAVMVLRRGYDRTHDDPQQFVESAGADIMKMFRNPVLTQRHDYNGAFGRYSFESHITSKVKADDESDAYEFWYLLTLLHPDQPRLVFVIGYSDRSPMQRERDALRGEARRYFSAVRIDRERKE
jgi:hypothetical protein